MAALMVWKAVPSLLGSRIISVFIINTATLLHYCVAVRLR